MEGWLIEIIIGVVLTSLISILGWLGKNYLNNLVTTFKEEISEVSIKLDRVIEKQEKQEIVTAQIKIELDNVQTTVQDIKRHVDEHQKKIHELEVEQARISQWKKDKENGI